MVQYDMTEFISCIQCQGTMVLEDRGEVLDSFDVMSLFGYRCLSCGHVESLVVSPQFVENPKLGAGLLEVQQTL